MLENSKECKGKLCVGDFYGFDVEFPAADEFALLAGAHWAAQLGRGISGTTFGALEPDRDGLDGDFRSFGDRAFRHLVEVGSYAVWVHG